MEDCIFFVTIFFAIFILTTFLVFEILVGDSNVREHLLGKRRMWEIIVFGRGCFLMIAFV